VEVEAMNEGHPDKSMATHAILKFKSILEHETIYNNALKILDSIQMILLLTDHLIHYATI
jgi:hypothetical protein